MSALEVFRSGDYELDVQRDAEGSFIVLAPGLAKALGFRESHDLLRTIPAVEKGSELVRTPGGEQRVGFVTEAGFYRALGQRQAARITDPEVRAEVERFQSWVYSVVLPAIRLGQSVAAPQIPSHAESLRGWADAVERAERAEFEVERLAPKAAMAMALIDSSGDYSVRDAAHILERDHGIDIGSKRLFSFLRTIGWIDKGKRPRPYQAQLTLGRLAVLSSTFVDSDGESHITTQVRITPKGLAELHRRLGGGPSLALVPGGPS